MGPALAAMGTAVGSPLPRCGCRAATQLFVLEEDEAQGGPSALVECRRAGVGLGPRSVRAPWRLPLQPARPLPAQPSSSSSHSCLREETAGPSGRPSLSASSFPHSGTGSGLSPQGPAVAPSASWGLSFPTREAGTEESGEVKGLVGRCPHPQAAFRLSAPSSSRLLARSTNCSQPGPSPTQSAPAGSTAHNACGRQDHPHFTDRELKPCHLPKDSSEEAEEERL